MPGAAAALTSTNDDVPSVVAEWQRRRDTMLDELAGLPVVPPHGGWCLLMNLKVLGVDGDTASRILLEKAKIAATPMHDWGNLGQDYIRFVYANEPVHRLKGVRERIRQCGF